MRRPNLTLTLTLKPTLALTRWALRAVLWTRSSSSGAACATRPRRRSSSLYLPYISLYLPDFSPISPTYPPYISLYLPEKAQQLVYQLWLSALQGVPTVEFQGAVSLADAYLDDAAGHPNPS